MLNLLAALIAPTAFWIGYLYYKDRYQPEPMRVVGIAYLLGIVFGWLCLQSYGLLETVGLPSDPMSLAVNHRLDFLLYCVGIVGPVEELFKLLPFALVLMHLRAFDEKIDGIIYASCVALGFATYENVFYLSIPNGSELWGRAFASPLAHTMFASVWGYAIASAKLRGRPILGPGAAGLAVAALLHGLYDFLTVDPYLRVGAALVILAIWIWRIRTVLRLQEMRSALP